MINRERYRVWEVLCGGIWGVALVVVGLLWLLPGDISNEVWPVFVIASGLCLLASFVARDWEWADQRQEEPADLR